MARRHPDRVIRSNAHFGGKGAVGDGLDERLVITLVLIGVCRRKAAQRMAEVVAPAQVSGDGGRVAGSGVGTRHGDAAELGIRDEGVDRLTVDIGGALHVAELAPVVVGAARFIVGPTRYLFSEHPAGGDSLNVRGAYLHVLGDLLGSVGTVVAALVIQGTGWVAADPIVSIFTTLLIVRGAWSLMRESVDVLLEASPAHISCDDVRDVLVKIPGVDSVHDLHVWTLTSGVVAMSAHAVVPDERHHQEVLERAHDAMTPFGIGHITLQIERASRRHLETHQHA